MKAIDRIFSLKIVEKKKILKIININQIFSAREIRKYLKNFSFANIQHCIINFHLNKN